MEQEALQTPAILAKQFAQNLHVLLALKKRLQEVRPRLAMTIARGSSDHAATFAKYLLETKTGLITASAAPSIFTLYHRELPLKDCLVLAISQSGASPDVAEMLIAAKKAGAITVAIVNQMGSPLANAAEFVIPMWAEEEKAVAATKTYLTTLAALIHLTAVISDDNLLLDKLTHLPDELAKVKEFDWSPAVETLKNRQNALIIGRGYGFPIAQEAALKLKETSRFHAEALSSAELLHGPFALVEKDFPILVFAQQDETLKGILDVSKRIKQLGADVMLALPATKNQNKNLEEIATHVLPLPNSLHPICDPLLIIQAFYLMAAKLSIARGFNPDAPDNLSKVTLTW
jgi:glucosamine--fructose-6-phosphate aminotransferase (isomerizing)